MNELLQNFLTYLEEQVQNGSIYVWSGQGENGDEITEAWIYRCEPTESGGKTGNCFWKERIAEGKGDVLRAYDCSGLIMYYLQNLKGILKNDMSSNSLKQKCQKISKEQLQPGDFVFRIYQNGTKKGRAYHVGVVVDRDMNVIEAKGRDDGVVKRSIDAQSGYWNYYGHLECLFDETNEVETVPAYWELSRLLKQNTPMMQGDDVKNVQLALMNKGFSCGKCGADGKYGGDTKTAVQNFQRKHGLTADGIVGENTCSQLGGTWSMWELGRLLKLASPLMKGDDVKHVQKALIDRGYFCGNCGIDGKYGSDTQLAVKRFQSANNLVVDGIVGAKTCVALGGTWI